MNNKNPVTATPLVSSNQFKYKIVLLDYGCDFNVTSHANVQNQFKQNHHEKWCNRDAEKDILPPLCFTKIVEDSSAFRHHKKGKNSPNDKYPCDALNKLR